MTLQARCGGDLSLRYAGDVPFVAFFRNPTAIEGTAPCRQHRPEGYVCAW